MVCSDRRGRNGDSECDHNHVNTYVGSYKNIH